MAPISLSLKEGSLARRTALHVGIFVLATAAFLALASFTLTAIVKGFLPSEKDASAANDGSGDESASAAPAGNGGKPSLRPSRKKRGAAVEQPKPAAEDDDQ